MLKSTGDVSSLRRRSLLHTRGTIMMCRLARVSLLCLTMGMAPQALTQNACGAPITLTPNQWRMVAIPCNPGADNTIVDVFGTSLGVYGTTWIAWKRTYDASGNDAYVKLASTDTVSTGEALWLYSTVAGPLQVGSATATSTVAPFPVTTPPPTTNSKRFFLFANPYNEIFRARDLRFTATYTGGGGITNASTRQAVRQNILERRMHFWNGNTYFSRGVRNNNGSRIQPYESCWLEISTETNQLVTLEISAPQP